MSQNLSQIEFQNQEKVKIKSIRSEQKILFVAISFFNWQTEKRGVMWTNKIFGGKNS